MPETGNYQEEDSSETAGGRGAVSNEKSEAGLGEVGIARWMSIWKGRLGDNSRIVFLKGLRVRIG